MYRKKHSICRVWFYSQFQALPRNCRTFSLLIREYCYTLDSSRTIFQAWLTAWYPRVIYREICFYPCYVVIRTQISKSAMGCRHNYLEFKIYQDPRASPTLRHSGKKVWFWVCGAADKTMSSYAEIVCPEVWLCDYLKAMSCSFWLRWLRVQSHLCPVCGRSPFLENDHESLYQSHPWELPEKAENKPAVVPK